MGIFAFFSKSWIKDIKTESRFTHKQATQIACEKDEPDKFAFIVLLVLLLIKNSATTTTTNKHSKYITTTTTSIER